MNNELSNLTRLTTGLLQAGRQWRRLVEAALAADNISDAQASPVLWLRRLGGGVRQVTLAAHIGIESTSLVRLLDQLCEAGLVVRRDDPEDRRAKSLWLTEAGEQLAERIDRPITELRNNVLGHVSDEDIEATLRVLNAVERAYGNLNQTASPCDSVS
jgi:MarR family transcriptional regulator for hemolysin